MTFSDNLRALRRAKEYSQESLAQQLGVTRQTVSKWENGTAMPDLKKLTEIAALFDTTMDALLGTDQPTDGDHQAQTAYDLQALGVRLEKSQRRSDWLTGILIVLAVLVAVLLILVVSAFSQIDGLQGQINDLPANTVVVNDNGDDDTRDTPDEYTTATVLKVDKKDPKIATVRLSYAPERYDNGSTVSFLVPMANGKQKEIPATLKDNAFTAEVTTDVTVGDNWQVMVNDGKTTGRWDFYAGLAADYLPQLEWSEDLADSSYEDYSYKNGYSYAFGDNSQLISWHTTGFLTVDQVRLVGTDQEDKVLVNQPLHIVSRGEGNLALVNLPNVTTKSQVQNFRLDFTTKEGVKGTINWQDEAKMALTFPGGGELVCYF